jgi:NitT/TauT family transport system permease protein
MNTTIPEAERIFKLSLERLIPLSGIAGLVVLWAVAVAIFQPPLIPGPRAVALALLEFTGKSTLLRHVVASLFRVLWGYLGAAAIGIPLGLCLGWFPKSERMLGPLLQILRPISPIAWIPLAILWLGVGDLPSIFIIFLGAFFPIVTSSAAATSEISLVHRRAAKNFGLSIGELARTVIVPAALPQIIVGLRLALGIAWLVVVAAEMVAVDSGLGYLIINARNAGSRYDLVVAVMLVIGAIGVALDWAMRKIESALTRSRP